MKFSRSQPFLEGVYRPLPRTKGRFMKHLAVLCALLFAGCVTDVEEGAEQTGAAEQTELQITPIALPIMIEATTSVAYQQGSVTDATIWPTNRNISSVEIVYMAVPTRGLTGRFLAFVVWNGNFVAHIFSAPNNSIGRSLQNVIANTLEERVTYGTDTSAIITGSVSGGPVTPLPHPNVDNEFTFTASYLTSVKTQATTALASSPIFQIPTIPIYEPGL